MLSELPADAQQCEQPSERALCLVGQVCALGVGGQGSGEGVCPCAPAVFLTSHSALSGRRGPACSWCLREAPLPEPALRIGWASAQRGAPGGMRAGGACTPHRPRFGCLQGYGPARPSEPDETGVWGRLGDFTLRLGGSPAGTLGPLSPSGISASGRFGDWWGC